MNARVLVTCPPMIKSFDLVRSRFDDKQVDVHLPQFAQTLSVAELLALVPEFDGWIIGDDPATEEVFAAGRDGRLRAAVKWGVGVDNVDREGATRVGLNVPNTPEMFGGEVADIALGYLIALARRTFDIDRGVRAGAWPKPAGMSLAGKCAAVVGFGDIGRALAKRLAACDVEVIVYDPFSAPSLVAPHLHCVWPSRLETADFVILACSLNEANRGLVCAETLARMKAGSFLINVARGPLVDEADLVEALKAGHLAGAALEVFEVEPLPADSPLRASDNVILGSHNASNTTEAVVRTSHRAIDLLFAQLQI